MNPSGPAGVGSPRLGQAASRSRATHFHRWPPATTVGQTLHGRAPGLSTGTGTPGPSSRALSELPASWLPPGSLVTFPPLTPQPPPGPGHPRVQVWTPKFRCALAFSLCCPESRTHSFSCDEQLLFLPQRGWVFWFKPFRARTVRATQEIKSDGVAPLPGVGARPALQVPDGQAANFHSASNPGHDPQLFEEQVPPAPELTEGRGTGAGATPSPSPRTTGPWHLLS